MKWLCFGCGVFPGDKFVYFRFTFIVNLLMSISCMWPGTIGTWCLRECLFFLAVFEEVLSELSRLYFICILWKEEIDWLEFGFFKLMVYVTIFRVRLCVFPVVSLPMD